MVKVAILGIGTVGGGTAEVLTKNRELIARRAGQEIELKYILCRRARPDHPFAHLIVHDIDTIVNDPEIGVHRRGDPRLRVRQALSRSGEKRRHVQ